MRSKGVEGAVSDVSEGCGMTQATRHDERVRSSSDRCSDLLGSVRTFHEGNERSMARPRVAVSRYPNRTRVAEAVADDVVETRWRLVLGDTFLDDTKKAPSV